MKLFTKSKKFQEQVEKRKKEKAHKKAYGKTTKKLTSHQKQQFDKLCDEGWSLEQFGNDFVENFSTIIPSCNGALAAIDKTIPKPIIHPGAKKSGTKQSDLKKNMECFVYIIQKVDTYQTKVGISKDVEERCNALMAASGDLMEIKWTMQCRSRQSATNFETFLHTIKHEQHMFGEWFDDTPKEFYDECENATN